MNCWSILGISPTEEISIIKKAYAQKLKIYHPEDNAEGYQKLREAYDSAIKYAKHAKKFKQEPSLESIESDDNTLTSEYDSTLSSEDDSSYSINFKKSTDFGTSSINRVLPESYYTEKNNEFMDKVNVLYNDFFSRIEKENWEKLLNCEAVWNIKNKRVLGNELFNYLIDHRFLPQSVNYQINSGRIA